MRFDPSPLVWGPAGLDPAWIDYNGHLNMAYYNVLFDSAGDAVTAALGLDGGYRAATGCSIFTGEAMVRYRRELRPDARVTVEVRLVDHDDRRLHLWKEMRHVEGWVAATCSVVWVHVDPSVPRSVPFPPDRAAAVAAMAAAHAALPRPEGMDRAPGIRRR